MKVSYVCLVLMGGDTDPELELTYGGNGGLARCGTSGNVSRAMASGTSDAARSCGTSALDSTYQVLRADTVRGKNLRRAKIAGAVRCISLLGRLPPSSGLPSSHLSSALYQSMLPWNEHWSTRVSAQWVLRSPMCLGGRTRMLAMLGV